MNTVIAVVVGAVTGALILGYFCGRLLKRVRAELTGSLEEAYKENSELRATIYEQRWGHPPNVEKKGATKK